MPKAAIELQRGKEWADDDPTIFVMIVLPEASEDRRLNIEIRAAFLPYAVPTGFIVKTDCYIGCTGARFQCRVVNGEISSATGSSTLETQHEIETGKADGLAAKESAALGPASAEVNAQIQRRSSKKVAFAHGEGELISTPINQEVIRWSLFSHRGEKAVRDFLEGALSLKASCRWLHGQQPYCLVEGQPSDRRFYGGDRREFSLMKSLAFAAKLLAKGVPLPDKEKMTYLVKVVKT